MTDYTRLSTIEAQRQLHTLAKEGEAGELRAFLRQRQPLGLDVDCIDLAKAPPATPLMVAVRRAGGDELAQLLIDAGADVEHEDAWGMRPAMHAAAYGRPENLTVLACAGADLAAKGKEGRSAFSYLDLYARDTPQVLMQLLNAGCDPNELLGGPGTHDTLEHALFDLNQDKALGMLEALLEAGADPLVTDEKSETPMTLAGAQGQAAAEQRLRHYAGLPRFAQGKTYPAEELLRMRNAGQRMVDNPHNWRRMLDAPATWLQEDAPLGHAELMSKGADGRSAAETAFGARCGGLVLRWLEARGEHIETDDLYAQGKPAALLETMCRTGQAALLLAPERVGHYSANVVRDIYRRLPEEQQAQVPLHDILLDKQTEMHKTAGVRGR